jgi:HAD superfamily hydrolase (TIGR01509 family)
VPVPVTTLLVDVGATLWPHQWEPRPTDEREWVSCFIGVMDTFSYAEAARVLDNFEDALRAQGPVDRPDEIMVNTLAAEGVTISRAQASVIRAALCFPALGRIEPMPGAAELLRLARLKGLSTVIISNARIRDRALYRRDFVALELDEYVDDYVTSVDVGVRKPHPDIFLEAVRRAGARPEECLMIGDDPRDDVQGALALGMRALLVNVRQLAPADVPEAASVVPDLPAAPAAVEKILAGGTVREWAHARSGPPER